MKIREILEARYAIQKPNVRDVHLVARKYKQFVSHPNSDYDLWSEGKPAINQKGTISQGFTTLHFTFQNKSAEDSLTWVRNFVGSYSLPYSEMWADGPNEVPIQGNDNLYTRVTIKYAEHEPASRRSVPTPVREARYAHVPTKVSVQQVFNLYQEHNSIGPSGLRPIVHPEVPRPNPFIKARQRRASDNKEIFAQISFVWKDNEEIRGYRDLQEYRTRIERRARDYMKHHQLPYTKMLSRTRDVSIGQIRFEYRLPKRLREARYGGPRPTYDDVVKIYTKYEEALPYDWETHAKHIKDGSPVAFQVGAWSRDRVVLEIIFPWDVPNEAGQKWVRGFVKRENIPYTNIDVDRSDPEEEVTWTINLNYES